MSVFSKGFALPVQSDKIKTLYLAVLLSADIRQEHFLCSKGRDGTWACCCRGDSHPWVTP